MKPLQQSGDEERLSDVIGFGNNIQRYSVWNCAGFKVGYDGGWRKTTKVKDAFSSDGICGELLIEYLL